MKQILIFPDARDWIYSTGAVLIIIILIILGRFFKEHFKLSEEIPRKVIHFIVGAAAAFAPHYYKSPLPLLGIALFFGIVNYIAIKKGFFRGIHGSRYSYGTVWFPAAYIILILTCWPEYKFLITLGIMLFAVPDALAAIAGERKSSESSRFVLIRDIKSVEGFIVMFATSILTIALIYFYFNLNFKFNDLANIITIAFLVTVTETLSSRGSDNFFVPIVCALFMYIFLNANEAMMQNIYLAVMLSVLVSVLSYRMRFLSLSGSVMTVMLGTLIFGLGGLKWTIPILTFFVFSSLLSRAGKDKKKNFKDTFEKTGVRDYAQVLANGGIGGLLVVINYFYPSTIVYDLYILSLAVAMADTWGTEIGVYFKARPWLITSLKKVEPGISGAVSIHGSFGALAGSLILTASGLFYLNPFSLNHFILIVFLGFAGSVIDSIFGATIQAQYHCAVCNKYTEKIQHCDTPSILDSGYRIINNDFVNLSSTIVIIIFYLTIIHYI